MANKVYVKFQLTQELNEDGTPRGDDCHYTELVIFDDYDSVTINEWATPQELAKEVTPKNILKLIYKDFSESACSCGYGTNEKFWDTIIWSGGLDFCGCWYSLEELGYYDGIEDVWTFSEEDEE
jgi:hypothetical protein